MGRLSLGCAPVDVLSEAMDWVETAASWQRRRHYQSAAACAQAADHGSAAACLQFLGCCSEQVPCVVPGWPAAVE